MHICQTAPYVIIKNLSLKIQSLIHTCTSELNVSSKWKMLNLVLLRENKCHMRSRFGIQSAEFCSWSCLNLNLYQSEKSQHLSITQ